MSVTRGAFPRDGQPIREKAKHTKIHKGAFMNNFDTFNEYGEAPIPYQSNQMSSLWNTVTWDIARASGFTAYVLLALAGAVGLLLSTQVQLPSRWPRLLNSELHNFLSLLSTIFLSVHILAVWIDPFTHLGWRDILLPFVSQYRTLWMALGIVALYLGIAIGISTWLRPRIGYAWWRRLHILTLGVYALAALHGIGIGSDTQTTWAFGLYLVSIVLVGLLLCRRLFIVWKKRSAARVHSSVRVAEPPPQKKSRVLV